MKKLTWFVFWIAHDRDMKEFIQTSNIFQLNIEKIMKDEGHVRKYTISKHVVYSHSASQNYNNYLPYQIYNY